MMLKPCAKSFSNPILTAALLASAISLPAFAGGQQDSIGYLDLVDRLGGNAPDGTGVLIGQTEAPINGSYAPDPTIGEFSGKTIVEMSGASGNSSHASTVGRHLYGNTNGAASGVTLIHSYEANNWITTGFLRAGGGAGQPPINVPVDIFNHSWIGNAGAGNNEVLRRTDHAIDEQDIFMAVGVNNGDGPLDAGDSLLSHAYNVISVGAIDPQGNVDSHHGNTINGIDGPGRMKPEICAIESQTSWATPVVSSCAAILIETARTASGLSNNPNADKSEVIKAVLMAGAVHRPGWSNNPATSGSDRGQTTTPLDEEFGADLVNINRSHLILTGLEFDASNSIPASGSAPFAGWDFLTTDGAANRWYRFELDDPKDEVSIILTWHRRTNAAFSTSQLPNMQLQLFRLQGTQPISLVGDLARYDAGNVNSVSTVDNVEHLYIQGLDSGDYALRVQRTSDGLGTWDAAVAWIMPEDIGGGNDIFVSDVTAIRGNIIGGNEASLSDSDDSYLRVNSVFGFLSSEPNVNETEFIFQGADASPSTVSLTIESRTNNPNGMATVRLRNYNNGNLDVRASYDLTTSDTTEVIANQNGAKYVNDDAQSEARIKHVVIATFSLSGFVSFYDLVELEAN